VIDFLLANPPGLVDTISAPNFGITPHGMMPTGHRHFMAGPRATDAYEPRQIRKEAAISKADCVAGSPAIPVLLPGFRAPANQASDPAAGIVAHASITTAKPPLIAGLSA